MSEERFNDYSPRVKLHPDIIEDWLAKELPATAKADARHIARALLEDGNTAVFKRFAAYLREQAAKPTR